ncbi:LVIS_2131 family protein [Lactobacillaceae bacterium Melli_B3]
MIISIRKRNRQALLQQSEKLVKRNLWISIFQGSILIISIIVMTFISLRTDKTVGNVSVTRNYKPIVLDTDGRKSYYVNVYNSSKPKGIQYYTYLTKGEHYKISSNDSIIIDGKTTVSLPMSTYHSDEDQMKVLDQKYQKAWIEIVNAKYKPNILNGLGMRVGRYASRYVIIRVPDQSFIYYR